MRKMCTSHLKKDKILFFLWPIIASAISLAVGVNYFVSIVLFFIVPTLYLAIKNKRAIKKAVLFSASSLVLAVVLDYIFDITQTWYVPFSIIEYRFLGQVPIENILWLFFWFAFVCMYYEYFLENGEKDVLFRPKLKYLYFLFISLGTMFFAIYFIDKSWLAIKYFYLKSGIILGLFPISLVLFKFPKLLVKFVKTGVYFFYLSLVYELTALSLNHWTFSGKEVIGMITIGDMAFPVEELFFWIVLGSLAILSYYEFFDDDCK